jgi:hypothetical protein
MANFAPTKKIDLAIRSSIRHRLSASWGRAWQSICEVADHKPLLFALVAVLFLQACTVIMLRPSYATNDDIFITMIASGKGLCPAPDAHLVFTNVLVGDVLKRLYTALPTFPWYGCYLLAAHWLAQTAILYCALVIGRDRSKPCHSTGQGARQTGIRLGVYALYFALVELCLLNRFQFTTTAFVVSQAGIFLICLAWKRRVEQANSAVLGPLCAAVPLLLLGGMIRLESLAMALLVAIPVGLIFLKQFSLRAAIPCAVAATIAAALVVAAVVYDNRVYENDPTWHGYRSLNQLRGQFHDGSWTFYGPETAAIFEHAGWSENDHAMIARWFSDDPALYSESKLSSIAGAYPWKSERDMPELWWHAFRDIARNRSVLAALLALPCILVFIHRGTQARIATLSSLAAALALIALVIWIKKVPPERVYFPLLSFPLAVAMLSFAWPSGNAASAAGYFSLGGKVKKWNWLGWRSLPRLHQIAAIMCLVAIVMGIDRQIGQSVVVRRDRVALNRFLNEMAHDGPKLCVCWEAALPFERHSPLDNLNVWSHIPLLSLTWIQCTPWHEEMKQRFGITNLARALAERKDIVLVATPTHRSLFTTFAKEHFGADVEFVQWRQVGDKFVAGKFQLSKADESIATKPSNAALR